MVWVLCSFSLPHNKQLLGLPAGMCIKVKVGELEQAYNPISTDETPGEVILLVKVSCSDLVRTLEPGHESAIAKFDLTWAHCVLLAEAMCSHSAADSCLHDLPEHGSATA